ncbi:acyl-CoA dehydrogenase [Heliobacterium gestii]|uniref:Acyl-CoA dehydrogenase n=1 Tax=Heliomicrobium gestii TaxID=2699 RepID=A0A845LE41_HELGE|nr:acyl-CoA dehydrogenase family protein [Heliomicrobium gestii]MBM7867368.1 alkylation response protein AidB-like acyl-CoA dehydrogenase [Heliomicrobium gestii]MZP43634.1 acyl-CoA dehydrogenase [Heliomicrobium gestii]
MSDFIRGGSFLTETLAPEQVFTPEDFTEEQRTIAQTTADFIAGNVTPHLEQIEKLDYGLTRTLLREAGEIGLLGADIPEAYDGVALDKISSTLITENMARGGSFGLSHGAHVGIGTLPIVFFGNEEQKQRYLPALGSGEKIAAYCLTEPGSGSDALGAKTKALLSEDGRHYRLNGTKQYITNAGFADVFVIYAKVDGDKFTAFIVDRDTPGLSIGPEEKKMGIKGSSTCPVILEDASVPVENVLGEIGKGHQIAFNILNIGRYKLGAGCIGSAKWAIHLSTKYANARAQFNTPIARFPLIQEKIADMAIELYGAESVIYRTAGLIEKALEVKEPLQATAEYAAECSICKILASEMLDQVADEGVQIHGGYGYTQEYEIERMYRDARINRIFEGTNEINRLLIPDTLLKRAMKGEIPLLAAAQRLQSELFTLGVHMDDGVPLSVEADLVERSKKTLIFVAGLAVQKYQKALAQEQEILRNMADLVINVFAMESALLRAKKKLAQSNQEQASLSIDLARAFVNRRFGAIEQIAKQSLAAMEEGDTLRAQLSILKKLTRHLPVNEKALKRKIAQPFLEAEKYAL